MSSESGSIAQRPEPLEGRPVRRVAVLTHGKPGTIGPALARLEVLARDAGVELLLTPSELEKHGVDGSSADPTSADLAVVLGGDGTILRALAQFVGTGVPVLGVNFGRVGFLASMLPPQLESGLTRVFAGDYVVVELPSLELELEAGGERHVAVNDVVALSAMRGRMVQLAWAIDDEDLGRQPCDGIICSTPSGSTAYNLSNGGPVLVWGLDAMAVTFIAPHSLHARPLVVPRNRELLVWNRTPDVAVSVLVDGHGVAELRLDARLVVRLGPERSLLATLPEATFLRRYRDTFSSWTRIERGGGSPGPQV